MSFTSWLTKERAVWHRRFIPSLVAGLAVALVTIFFEMTTSNIILFASLGASAAILTHKYVHRLSILRTVLLSYLVALLLSIAVLFFIRRFSLPAWLSVLLTVTSVTLGIYLFNVFHPPAVGASLSFITFEGSTREMLIVFFSVLVLLVLIKLLTYVFYYENLQLRKFKQEFRKLERKGFLRHR